ncbi:MAG TPA: CoA activase [Clostridiaceae bacterium]|nr:CoA activase [Clostridiaceae bacterium]
MKTAGICIGASTITLVCADKSDDKITIMKTRSISHEGNPKKVLLDILKDGSVRSADRIAFTGRKLRHFINARTLSEPEAVEEAYGYFRSCHEGSQREDRGWTKSQGMITAEVGSFSRGMTKGDTDPITIVSAGGETFMVYSLDSDGRIIEVKSGNKCASGTGEFFLQQLKRMDLSVEAAMEIADVDEPYKVAGRCSVFCKSDCTHALNKGAAKSKVVAGLCRMMAGKIEELMTKKNRAQVLLVGGSSSNRIMVKYLKDSGLNVVIPPYSHCFEALGAALWALKNETVPISEEKLFKSGEHGFPRHEPLSKAISKVRFMDSVRGTAEEGDMCILGLDVGSTTTKAVLMRCSDKTILAGVYLRTNGDPVGASRRCYEQIAAQLDVPVKIIGLGVTGSGRQIAGLHALTPAVINEIIAHARAAAHFDPEVDTIFEIGGQDAKYTYLINGVASDYAMNEACSAGTGSFLEESALEALNLKVEDIGEIAIRGKEPPNFNDQCAAFIGSDIKTAIQNGISRDDIAAGLVYSICLNYLNRVKGNRAVGQKVFMQGGVCYNKAVPVAMASLTGKEIIVPPEPGLMGAFGVALETLSMLELKQIEPMSFDLKELADRQVIYDEPFVCAGGKEKCDRKCTISRIRIENKVYPFGGACNKYYNMRVSQKDANMEELDFVALRERLLLNAQADNGDIPQESRPAEQRCVPIANSNCHPTKENAAHVLDAKNLKDSSVATTLVVSSQQNDINNKGLPQNDTSNVRKVGINFSLMTNTFFPLYSTFFRKLGYEVVYDPKPDSEGCSQKGAPFCWPVEQAHGILKSLLKLEPDIVFLPHVKAYPVPGGQDVSVCCPFVQAEPYTLKAAFPELEKYTVLAPVLDMTNGYEAAESAFVEAGKRLGHTAGESMEAFRCAVEAQNAFHKAAREAGRKIMEDVINSGQTAVVLFGRPYNAFSGMGNMGIPKKLASRGIKVIPQDFLPVHDEDSHDKMYWASGQWILKAARYVSRHENLFGVYITNFSCGPDSFLITYFRNIMGEKPSLTLELDSHTADAGVDTRIEAFLDVVRRYRDMKKAGFKTGSSGFDPSWTAEVVNIANRVYVRTPDGEKYPISHPKVKILVPSMGDIGARMLAATLSYVGANTVPLPPPGEKELAIGRKFTTCKECLPLQLTFGSLMRYVDEVWNGEDILVNFMPEASGPCRFGQYNVMMRELVAKKGHDRIAMLSLTSENSYAGFGVRFALRAWQSVILSDVLDDIKSAIIALAVDPEKGLEVFNRVSDGLIESIRTDKWPLLRRKIVKAARELSSIPRKGELDSIPSIALIGEIYVRRDGFSRQFLVDKLSRKGFWVRVAPVAEWIHYCDYIVQNRLVAKSKLTDRVKNRLTCMVKNPYEFEIKSILEQSGFYKTNGTRVEDVVEAASEIVSPRLTGETVLTVGSALKEIVEEVDGVISLGPFGCMPSRLAEALITQKLKDIKPKVAEEKELVKHVMEAHPSLPFLSVETDGNTFPQLIESRLEAFLLQVNRLFESKRASGTVLRAHFEQRGQSLSR